MTDPIGYRIVIDLIDTAGYGTGLKQMIEEEVESFHGNRSIDLYCTKSVLVPLYASTADDAGQT